MLHPYEEEPRSLTQDVLYWPATGRPQTGDVAARRLLGEVAGNPDVHEQEISVGVALIMFLYRPRMLSLR